MREFAIGVLALVVTASIPALAQSRDQPTRDRVIGAAMRCSTIDNDRAWLDCYYGAAQPMRGRLGLPPAPQSQIRLIPQGNATGTSHSAGISRLTPPVNHAETSAPIQHRQDSHGFLADVFGGATIERNVRVASYKFDRRGFFTVTLANGQIWEQLSGDRAVADWNKPAGQYLVTIRDGALGSTNLFVVGDNRLYKVRRVK